MHTHSGLINYSLSIFLVSWKRGFHKKTLATFGHSRFDLFLSKHQAAFIKARVQQTNVTLQMAHVEEKKKINLVGRQLKKEDKTISYG